MMEKHAFISWSCYGWKRVRGSRIMRRVVVLLGGALVEESEPIHFESLHDVALNLTCVGGSCSYNTKQHAFAIILALMAFSEQQPLLIDVDTGADGAHAASVNKRWQRVAIVTVGLFSAAAAVSLVIKPTSPNISVSASNELSAATKSIDLENFPMNFGISVTNEYGDLNNRQRSSTEAQDYPFLSNSYLIEAYKVNTVKMTAPLNMENQRVHWTLSPADYSFGANLNAET